MGGDDSSPIFNRKRGCRLKRGDLVFVKGKGIIANTITFFDKGTFSHCAIAISESQVIEADYDTRVTVSLFKKEDYSVIEVIDLGLSPRQRERIYQEALTHIGKKYDFMQIVWYLIGKAFRIDGRNKFNNPSYLICSELVYIVLRETGALIELGIEDSFKNGADLTPNELYDLVKFVSNK